MSLPSRTNALHKATLVERKVKRREVGGAVPTDRVLVRPLVFRSIGRIAECFRASWKLTLIRSFSSVRSQMNL